MKTYLSFLSLMLLLSCIPVSGYALPYTGADIELQGIEYSDISHQTPEDPELFRGWRVSEDGSIRTAWAGRWVEYQVELSQGNWNIGLNVLNSGDLGEEGWYDQFKVHSSLTNEIIKIDASDTEIFHGFINVDISSSDSYSIKFTWLNDKYNPPLDANIKIKNIFFDDTSTSPTPEPGTLLLLSLGLIGLAGLKKRIYN